jgi:hypothetical protein
VRAIAKKWLPKVGGEKSEPEERHMPQRICSAKVIERVLQTKRLRIIVAASVALGVSLFVHPSLAIIIAPISTLIYTREIISFWRKR